MTALKPQAALTFEFAGSQLAVFLLGLTEFLPFFWDRK